MLRIVEHVVHEGNLTAMIITRHPLSPGAATLFCALLKVPVRVALRSRMERMGSYYGDWCTYERRY